MIRAAIVTAAIDPAALLAEVASDSHGATSLFVGTVRDVNDGRAVKGMEYTAYDAMATRELRKIADEAAERFSGVALAVEHRVGKLELGDVSVVIAAAHAHRAHALDATRQVIEQIKKRVPIWKREHYADGSREWVDPTAVSAAVPAGPDTADGSPA
jgi:molybdopterin synthase catalytic subunit